MSEVRRRSIWGETHGADDDRLRPRVVKMSEMKMSEVRRQSIDYRTRHEMGWR